MSIRLFSFIILFSTITGSTLFSSDYNQTSGYYNVTGDYNTTSANSAYPFLYQYNDGLNDFCNVVAGLNYGSPILALCVLKIGNYCIGRWNNQIDDSVREEVAHLADAENAVRTFLSSVIQGFRNGINDDRDYYVASALVEDLNRRKCENCINEFVDIVSKHIENTDGNADKATLDVKITDSADSTSEDQSLLSKNRDDFYDFAPKMRQNSCAGHDFQKLSEAVCKKKTISNKVHSALCDNWLHPLHKSSLLYALVLMSIPPIAAPHLRENMQAGSLFGDWANISNILAIPTAQAFNIFQHYWNHDRKKAQKLLDEIERRLVSINGIVEIAARAIGKMDNGITVEQAKGFLKALILIGWPEERVEEFRALATRQTENTIGARKAFVKAVKSEYKNKKILYGDEDIKGAFDFASESSEMNDNNDEMVPVQFNNEEMGIIVQSKIDNDNDEINDGDSALSSDN